MAVKKERKERERKEKKNCNSYALPASPASSLSSACLPSIALPATKSKITPTFGIDQQSRSPNQNYIGNI